jgi:ATP-dependent DNA ligase
MEHLFRQVEPALARGRFRPSLLQDPDWTAEIKYDGDRRIAQFCDGVVRFTGRTVSKKDGLFVEKTDNLPHLQTRRVRGLAGTVLDGEVIVSPTGSYDAGGRSKHVTSIMGSTAAEAIRKQEERGWLNFVVFDCLWFRGKDIRERPQHVRRAHAADTVAAWDNAYVSLASECPDRCNKGAWVDALMASGEEGAILKNREATYGDNNAWVKVKCELNADAFIIGYEEAKRESVKRDGSRSATRLAARGWIGALRVAQWRDGAVWECASVSGMDDALRAEISADPEAYLGRVVELKANAREPSGKFRHPRFTRFRTDKSSADCVYRPNET